MLLPDYIGDGVYATHKEDGDIMLTTGTHEEHQADNVIHLEPDVLNSLHQYMERVKEENQRERG